MQKKTGCIKRTKSLSLLMILVLLVSVMGTTALAAQSTGYREGAENLQGSFFGSQFPGSAETVSGGDLTGIAGTVSGNDLAETPNTVSGNALPAQGPAEDFPAESEPDIKAYRLNGDLSKGEQITDQTLMKLGDSLLLSFTWKKDTPLDSLGIVREKSYSLCRIPSQLSVEGNGEIPLYMGDGTQFATVRVGAPDATGLREVTITFLLVDGLMNAEVSFGCVLQKGSGPKPADGVLRIEGPAGKALAFPVSDFLPAGPHISLEASDLSDRGLVTWQALYTAPEAGYETSPFIGDKIPVPVKLSSELPAGMEYVKDSARVEVDGVPDVSAHIIYHADTHSLTCSLPQGTASGAKTALTYDTRLTDGTVYALWTENQAQAFSNTVWGLDGQEDKIIVLAATAEAQADGKWLNANRAISKNGSYTFQQGKRTASWEIVLQTVGREYSDLAVKDTLGKGLELIAGSVTVNNQAMTEGPDGYSLTKNPDGTTTIEFPFYQDGNLLISPDNNGNYKIDYKTEVSQDYFTQKPDPADSNRPLVGEEDVENLAELSWEWKNTPGGGPEDPPPQPKLGLAPVLPSGLNNTMLQTRAVGYDPGAHTAIWEITINPNAVKIDSANFSYVLAENGILEKEGVEYKLSLAGSKEELEKAIQDQLPQGASLTGFYTEQGWDDARILGVHCGIKNLGANPLRFQVKAEFEADFWSTNQILNPVGEAELHDVQVEIDGNTEYAGAFGASMLVRSENQVLGKENLSFVPENMMLQWQLTLNESKVKGLEGVTVTDTLPRGTIYVENSTKIDNIPQTDSGEFGKVTQNPDGTQTVTWKLDETAVEGKTAALTYETRIDPDYKAQDGSKPFLTGDMVTFSGNATLTAGVQGAVETKVTETAAVKNPLLSKTSERGQGNKIKYTATLNPYGVSLRPDKSPDGPVWLEDTMPAGLVPDMESLRLYKANVTAQKEGEGYEPVLTEGAQVVLSPNGITYQVETQKDGSTVNVFQILMEDKTPYILTYEVYAVQTNVDLTNRLSLKNSALPEGSSMGTGSSTVNMVAFGSANMLLPKGNWTIRLANVDESGTPIVFNREELNEGSEPAVFGLYTDCREDAKLLEAMCDSQTGVCTFSQPKQVLKDVSALYVRQLQSPTGYVSDNGYRLLTEDVLETLQKGGSLEMEAVSIKKGSSALDGKITVSVSYEGGVPAAAAVFSLFEEEQCLTLVGTGNSTDGGKTISFEGLYPGKTYYLKQTSVPEGYRPDTAVYPVKAGDGTGSSLVAIQVKKLTQQGDGGNDENSGNGENGGNSGNSGNGGNGGNGGSGGNGGNGSGDGSEGNGGNSEEDGQNAAGRAGAPKTGAPKTGDETNLPLWLLLAVISLAGVLVAVCFQKRGIPKERKKDRE